MQWGLSQSRGWTVDMAVPGTVRTIGMLLEPKLLEQVQEAAAVHRASMVAWLREAVRRFTRDDFRDSWRTGVNGVLHTRWGLYGDHRARPGRCQTHDSGAGL
jgi:hypothetical protein